MYIADEKQRILNELVAGRKIISLDFDRYQLTLVTEDDQGGVSRVHVQIKQAEGGRPVDVIAKYWKSGVDTAIITAEA